MDSENAFKEQFKPKKKIRIAHPTVTLNGKETIMLDPNPQ